MVDRALKDVPIIRLLPPLSSDMDIGKGPCLEVKVIRGFSHPHNSIIAIKDPLQIEAPPIFVLRSVEYYFLPSGNTISVY